MDGAVYAQPLYAANVLVNGQTRDVLYVATMNDKVYAFDARSASPVPLWVVDFARPPAIVPVPITDIVPANLNVVGNVGVQGTPVIDLQTGTMYLVARTREDGAYVQRLHALDISSGVERAGSPVVIGGTAAGSAPDATAGSGGRVITFDPKVQIQRAGLALSNGVVLIAWASHEDVTPSHGWIMGFDASTLAPVGVFAVAPDGYLGGIWQGGRAPAIDAAGNAYFATGNGPWDGVRNFGDSVLKFAVSRNGLTLVDYFTPANQAVLDSTDDDLSGSGFTLLPETNLLLGGGKEGVLYLLNAQQLGRQAPGDAQIPQKMTVNGGHVMGGPVYWKSPASGPLVYNWSEADVLKAFRLSNGRLVTTPYAQGQVMSPGHPGGSLTISANGSTAKTSIVWASMPALADARHGLAAGILRAFDAETLTQLWTSEQNAPRDRVGTLMKFVPPLIANGKVFLPNHDNAVLVYGLLAADFSVSAAPSARIVAPGTTSTFNVTITPQGNFTGTIDLTATGQPAGTIVTFNPPTVAVGQSSQMTMRVPTEAATGSYAVTVTGTVGFRAKSAAPMMLYVATPEQAPRAIGIDFVGTGMAMAAAETAGVVPQANWNSAAGAIRPTGLPLVDEAGAATDAAVAWSAYAGWALQGTDAPGNRRLMNGYLDTTSTSVTAITVDGLRPHAYDVYVYTDGDNRAYSRTAEYTISGPGIVTRTIASTDLAATNFAGQYIPALNSPGNYLKFSIVGTSFTVTATPSVASSATRRAPVNALQIVPAAAMAPRAISIDFAGTATATLSDTAVAGVVPKAHWNTAAGSNGTTAQLVDESGAITGATIAWAAVNGWMLPLAYPSPSGVMMKGYLDTSSTSATTIAVSGLIPAAYDVYVYGDGDNRAYTRGGTYTISGTGFSTTSALLTDMAFTDFTGNFVEATGSSGNYAKFRISGDSFTLTAAPRNAGGTTWRAPVNGVQIVPVATVD